jgi:predicted Zn-dependent peptidase
MRQKSLQSAVLAAWIALAAASAASAASPTASAFDAVKARVAEHTLTNGMKWIVLERHDAPVVSFHVYADAGSANELDGITGISHLLEHMAFKGTTTVGTTDYAAESAFLDRLDSLHALIRAEESRMRPDTARAASLRRTFEAEREKAQAYVVNNEYFDLCMQQGDRGVNAYTSADATQYINSMPSNRLEFWMALTSDRFLNPVFREFYKERDVVIEERRLGVETQPVGKLVEDFFASAFKAHSYRHEVIGHMSDLRAITHDDVKEYFRAYYSPSNLTAAIVGDVKADEVFRLAETYFGRIPSGPKPEPVRTVEPEQWGERRVQVEAQSQPVLILGYHRPDARHADDLAFDALSNIIGQGRSSRLYTALVKEKKIAVDVGSFNGWPGAKYPNLCAFYAFAAKEHTSQECLEAINAEIEKLKNEPVSADELTKYKRATVKSLYGQMKANASMASLLTFYDVVLGDWRETFDQVAKVEAMTAEDVRRTASAWLAKKNRTVAEIVPEPATAGSAQ